MKLYRQPRRSAFSDEEMHRHVRVLERRIYKAAFLVCTIILINCNVLVKMFVVDDTTILIQNVLTATHLRCNSTKFAAIFSKG